MEKPNPYHPIKKRKRPISPSSDGKPVEPLYTTNRDIDEELDLVKCKRVVRVISILLGVVIGISFISLVYLKNHT